MHRPDGPDLSHHILPKQLGEMLDEARSLLHSIEHGVVRDPKTGERGLNVYGLLDWAKAARGDGFPRGATREGGGPGTVLDEENVPMPPLSDPVGELVVAEDNSVRRSAADVRRGIRSAIDDLRMAVSALMKADKPPPAIVTDPGCRSCWRRKVWMAVAKVTKRVRVVDDDGNVEFVEEDVPLCRWCYDWNAAHKSDPPLEILQLHHEGRRITDRLVREVLGKKRKRSA